jgi:outer membrane protein insertion porin family
VEDNAGAWVGPTLLARAQAQGLSIDAHLARNDAYGFFSAEYQFDIVSPVRFAVFYDAGFVNAGAYDFSPAHYNDNFGVGLHLFVAGSPLALDFGIPLTTDKYNNKGNQFNFSFGTRY